jgi:hypothetical protein
LYVALYAADEDVRAAAVPDDGPLWMGDAFQLAFSATGGERLIDVGPTGRVTDARRTASGLDHAWSAGARVAKDLDGTLDDPRDDDEEWIIEMALPLASLDLAGKPGDRITLSLRRVDRTKTGHRRDGTARVDLVFDE